MCPSDPTGCKEECDAYRKSDSNYNFFVSKTDAKTTRAYFIQEKPDRCKVC